MCGIFGVFGSRAFGSELAAATARLAHRGPDGQGEWVDAPAGVYLAHFRLAIIDLTSASRQPFETERGILVFNGEIYNFKEIRAELEQRGCRFATTGDTEVLVRALEEWGTEGLHKLRGMFAFAFWDKHRRELLLVRDRFGIKPLFVLSDGPTLAFASEIEALRRLGWSRPRADVRALYHILNYLPAPYTFYDNIRKVLPGELLRVSSSGISSEIWYRLSPRNHGPIEELLRRSVREHTRCDVDYGVFLSGGLDSAIVAALTREYTGGAPRSFSIGFSSFPAFDEGRQAAASAAALGCLHRSHDVSPDEFEAAMEASLAKLSRGEPFADASFVPTWLVSRAARAGIKVAMSGDGADEVFGGYRKYNAMRPAGIYRAFPRSLRRTLEAIAGKLPEARDRKLLELFRRIRKFVEGAARDEAGRQLAWLYVFFPGELPRLGVSDIKTLKDTQSMLAARFEEMGELDELNRALYVDATIFLPADMLHKVDLASMDHALEVRVPFLDHELVETAFTLSGRSKIGIRTGKKTLRREFGRIVPAVALDAPKRGFESPMSSFFRRSWRDVVSSHSRILADLGVDCSYVRRLEQEHLENKADNSIRLWNLLVLANWAKTA